MLRAVRKKASGQCERPFVGSDLSAADEEASPSRLCSPGPGVRAIRTSLFQHAASSKVENSAFMDKSKGPLSEVPRHGPTEKVL